MIEGWQFQIVTHRVELMIFKVRIHGAGHGHRIRILVIKVPAKALICCPEETGIKPGVMRHKEF